MNYEKHEINLLKNQIAEIEKLKNVEAKRISALEEKMQEQYNKMFSNDESIQKAIVDLENSSEYTSDEYGEISAWLRFEFSDYDDCKDYLENYLNENHCVYCDFQNGALMMNQGESIVINHEGDIFDSHKFVITNDDYKTEYERNELIEEYMEKTGCFPGVFYQDYHCNLTLVKTQNEKVPLKDFCYDLDEAICIDENTIQWDNSLILDYQIDDKEMKTALVEIKDFSIKTEEYVVYIELLPENHCAVQAKFKKKYIEKDFISLRENLEEALDFLQNYAD